MFLRRTKDNPAIIKASNALYNDFVIDLRKYKKKHFVKKVQKNKAAYQLPNRVDNFN